MMIRNLLLITTLSIGLFTSCQKEEMSHGMGMDSSLINISFESSENLPQSRVSYTLNSDSSEYDFAWSAGDGVSLMITEPDTTKNFKFTAQKAQKISEFKGTIAPWDGEKNVYSVFPYAKGNYIIRGGEDINKATVRLVTGTGQSFNANTNRNRYKYENTFMVAAASGARAVSETDYNIPSLHFKQVMTLLKLNMTNIPADETVRNVKVTVTQKVFFPYADIEISSGEMVDGPVGNDKEAELNVKVQYADPGDIEIEMAFIPADISGFTMYFEIATEKGSKSDIEKTEYTITKPGIDFERNRIYRASLPLSKPEIIVPTNNLKLTANEVFFAPSGNAFKNVATPGLVGTDENQNIVFSHTTSWKTDQDTLVWGVDVIGTGRVTVTPVLGVPDYMNDQLIEVTLAGQTQQLRLKSTANALTFVDQETVSFQITKAGRYVLGMNVTDYTPANNQFVANVQGMNLAGTNGLILEPVILRWRPNAVHCGWRSTQVDDYIMVVHENTQVTTHADMYSPITTPFGYYGSGWKQKEQAFGGINFSLWSPVSQSAPLPPAVEFSHIIAVGENLEIDGFNHEGTGVKARVMKNHDGPFDNASGYPTQVLAMCKVPGYPHDTYYTYYFDLPNQKWKLYGCGKKYNKSGELTYMKTGAFLEKAGGSHTARTNNIMREMEYSAWVMNEGRVWFPMDQMNPNGGIGGNSFKNWGIKENNEGNEKFFMQMGGFDPILTEKIETLVLQKPAPTPSYLQGDHLKALIGEAGSPNFKLPATIESIYADAITTSSAMVNFDVTEIGTNPKVILYYGEYDGLTFVEGNKGNGAETTPFREGIHWDNIVSLSNKTAGTISYKIENLNPNTKYYYRLQIKSDQGETWSFDTQDFTTK